MFGHAAPHSQHIKADLLAESVITKLFEDALGSVPIAYEATYTSAPGGDTTKLEVKLKQLHKKQERLQEAYLSGVLDLEDLAKAKKSLDHDILQTKEHLEARRIDLDGNSAAPALHAPISAALQTLCSSDATTEEKNLAARSILESCVFDKAFSTLSVTYRIAL